MEERHFIVPKGAFARTVRKKNFGSTEQIK